ncbi:MAG TPA: hypothetical protein DDW94_12795 [Deltaproteobacteria bacterium]|nr:MAG: hypothetical protein A2Z79_06980 [Deltaproteobacteria bacterium GWA2_55_82]OGQ63251.1 MAG: hypothetical protein A3I81_00620 [Deltaproteobacteria bacterium RIFCSPLOWO2_02_FULL_55_12]OIJ73086.1 MAG: hypothetical protein A2V21_301685 [Deltaproteobacteria bacterium GWC2_55_46]HBG47848.1 hypothetical protein [Deltaproteobacteria bacterium]HCY11889.1 hypothetical protein [Deltaproteobacteria bacterium]
MIKAIVLGLLCFIIFLAAHASIYGGLSPRARLKRLLSLFAYVLPVYIAAYFLTPSGYLVLAPVGAPGRPLIGLETVYRLTHVINFLGGIFVYAFLFMSYLQLDCWRRGSFR